MLLKNNNDRTKLRNVSIFIYKKKNGNGKWLNGFKRFQALGHRYRRIEHFSLERQWPHAEPQSKTESHAFLSRALFHEFACRNSDSYDKNKTLPESCYRWIFN